MSGTETWGEDIQEIARDIVTSELEQMGELVTESDLYSRVEDCLSSMDIPTRDDVMSDDDVNDAIYDYLTGGNMDITDLVDAAQLFDNWEAQSAINSAVEDSEAITDLDQRVTDLAEQVGTEEPNGLADRVYDLEKWTQEREEGTPEENEGHNALVNEVKNLTERIVYMEGIINSFVDWADRLGDTGNAALAEHTAPYAGPLEEPRTSPAEDAANAFDAAPYAAI